MLTIAVSGGKRYSKFWVLMYLYYLTFSAQYREYPKRYQRDICLCHLYAMHRFYDNEQHCITFSLSQLHVCRILKGQTTTATQLWKYAPYLKVLPHSTWQQPLSTDDVSETEAHRQRSKNWISSWNLRYSKYNLTVTVSLHWLHRQWSKHGQVKAFIEITRDSI